MERRQSSQPSDDGQEIATNSLSPGSRVSLSPVTTELNANSNRNYFISQLLGDGASTGSPEQSRPSVLGIHHLKFAVSNLDVSIAWYERVLGARRVPELDHIRADGQRFAAVCRMIDWAGLHLELRLSRTQAHHARGSDPIILTVSKKEDLVLWIRWLDRWGTTRSPLLAGVRGWILIFEVSFSIKCHL